MKWDSQVTLWPLASSDEHWFWLGQGKATPVVNRHFQKREDDRYGRKSMFTIQMPGVHGATSDSGVKRMEARKCRYSHVQHLLCEVIREQGYTSISTVVCYTLNKKRTGSGHFNHSVLVFRFFLWSCQWLLKCKRSNQRTPAMRTCKTPCCLQDPSLNIVLQLPVVF